MFLIRPYFRLFFAFGLVGFLRYGNASMFRKGTIEGKIAPSDGRFRSSLHMGESYA